MDRRYGPEELDRIAKTVEGLLQGLPSPVIDAVLLQVLSERLTCYGAVPPSLEALQTQVEHCLPALRALCAEGPYDGLPVA